MKINLSENGIKEIAINHVNNTFSWEIGEGEFKIVSLEIFGSRKTGTNRPDSDLDIKLCYTGDLREDDVFNALNGDNQIYIDGIPLDFFPIKEEN